MHVASLLMKMMAMKSGTKLLSITFNDLAATPVNIFASSNTMDILAQITIHV
jgi:hypothetical protein